MLFILLIAFVSALVIFFLRKIYIHRKTQADKDREMIEDHILLDSAEDLFNFLDD